MSYSIPEALALTPLGYTEYLILVENIKEVTRLSDVNNGSLHHICSGNKIKVKSTIDYFLPIAIAYLKSTLRFPGLKYRVSMCLG